MAPSESSWTIERPDDPLANFGPDAQVSFICKSFAPTLPEGLLTVDNWEYFSGALLPVGIADGNNLDVCGSAIMVAPGVALSARHVIDEHLSNAATGTVQLQCPAISSAGAVLWEVRKIILPAVKTDMALLIMECRSALRHGQEFCHVALTTRLPNIGETVTVVGFRAEAPTEFAESTISVGLSLRSAQGQVSNLWPIQRDSYLLPWPSVEVDCPSLGGMSGGPAFDKNGRLIGLVCSSFDDGPTYVSLIWPSLTVEFEPVWPPCFRPEIVSLQSMSHRLCNIEGRESVQMINLPSGETKIHYRPWS